MYAVEVCYKLLISANSKMSVLISKRFEGLLNLDYRNFLKNYPGYLNIHYSETKGIWGKVLMYPATACSSTSPCSDMLLSDMSQRYL